MPESGSTASISDKPIKLNFKQAVVSFVDNDSKPNTSPVLPVDLLVTFDASARTACFRLRTAHLDLRASLSTSQVTKRPINILIQPEHIVSLVNTHLESAPEGIASAPNIVFPGEVFCWRFTLAQPSTIIVPRLQEIVPTNDSHARTWESIRLFAQHNEFSIYLDASSRLQSAPQLSTICELASARLLQSSSKHFNIATLYRGEGGIVYVLSQEKAAAASSSPPSGSPQGRTTRTTAASPDNDAAQTQSPPSYDELGPGPPSPPRQPARKRPRVSSSTAAAGQEKHEHPRTAGAAAEWGDILARAAEAESRLRAAIEDATASNVQLRKRAEDADETSMRLQKRAEDAEAVIARLQEKTRDLEETNIRLLKRVQDSEAANTRLQEWLGGAAQDLDAANGRQLLKEELVDYVDSRIEEARGELEDLMDVRIDESRTDLRCELQDEVEERLKQAEEEIKETLQSQGVTLFFNT